MSVRWHGDLRVPGPSAPTETSADRGDDGDDALDRVAFVIEVATVGRRRGDANEGDAHAGDGADEMAEVLRPLHSFRGTCIHRHKDAELCAVFDFRGPLKHHPREALRNRILFTTRDGSLLFSLPLRHTHSSACAPRK